MPRSEGIREIQGQAKVRWANVARNAQNEANGQLQATILKKCSTARHHPETNRACAGGTCQHTCQPGELEACRHAWTVMYWVNGRQREKSFRDEIDDRKRVRRGTGLAKAQDFQLKHTADKRAEGKTYTDPKAAEEPFVANAERFILESSRIKASGKSRKSYLGTLRGDIAAAFGDRTLAQMAAPAAADEVSAFLNTTIAHRSKSHRYQARMIIVGSMDAAVDADRIGRHRLSGVKVGEGTAVPRRQRIAEDDDESAAGFVFITDEQVRTLAEGRSFPPAAPGGRVRVLAGVGIAAWLQRTMGLRIREALGTEKRDFRTRRDGSRYLRLRAQATKDGRGREPLKHRAEGKGRDVPVPAFIWDMVRDMPDGPLCPGPKGGRYMPYSTARSRFLALTEAMGIAGYTTHSLRHQFASEAIDAGANIANVAATLGHLSVETTLRVYVHATADAEDRMRAMMNDRWTVIPGGRKDAPAPGRKARTGKKKAAARTAQARPVAAAA